MIQLLESASQGVRAQGDAVLIFASGVERCTTVTCLPVVSGASNSGVENIMVKFEHARPHRCAARDPPPPSLLPPCSSSAAHSLSSAADDAVSWRAHPLPAHPAISSSFPAAAFQDAPWTINYTLTRPGPPPARPAHPHRDEPAFLPFPSASHPFGPGEEEVLPPAARLSAR
eukprot:CAMPEP_0172197272 /NCGR_PEP_ID=MMETSP1050-20130122/27353_1 /TAXON_ID=233186 /ORGANISM="Cryptomonas curvata, Strain CCAP979/52" /LENGTH=171 /DNA_ID=CAMNT_0012873791 /DNA_START=426 /DNA_END=937 /DNA_ORIENTATION=+